MAPAVVIDNTPDLDFDYPPTKSPNPTPNNAGARTLLLAPPSLASSPDLLTELSAPFDRRTTDIQMLDRLALGLVSLPAATYDLALLLPSSSSSSSDADADTSSALLTRALLAQVVPALKVSGVLRVHDRVASASSGTAVFPAAAQTEAILAGLVRAPDGRGMVKPDPAAATQTVRLRLGGKRKVGGGDAAAAPAAASAPAIAATGGSEQVPIGMVGENAGNGKRKSGEEDGNMSAPAGVGFVNGDEAMDEDDEFPSNEELESAAPIDPDSLLTAEDRLKPLNIPEACKPNSKRRRACKDCTCGLAERLEAEDKATRAQADANLARLDANDLTEVDFTVKGKVGSCGNCALGDAFRCDGCPYIGLPAFKPGEEVRLLNNDIQL